MKKKISLLICSLILVLSIAGCGAKKETVQYNEETLQQYAEIVIGSFSQMDAETFENFKKSSDLQVNMMMMQSGLPVEKEEFISMIDSWNAAIEECGAFISHGEYETEEKKGSIVVKTEAEYEHRKATIEISFDHDDLSMKSMDISAHFTMGEIMKKAGLNTVLGMGTVFLVLIFLAFIISLLKYIPMIIEKVNRKEEIGKERPIEEKAVEEVEEETDDLELVAVIAAAIAAESGMSTDDFVVRSIKRKKSNKWN